MYKHYLTSGENKYQPLFQCSDSHEPDKDINVINERKKEITMFHPKGYVQYIGMTEKFLLKCHVLLCIRALGSGYSV